MHRYQGQVKAVKADYARSLRALEEISESIHARRKSRMAAAVLGAGVRSPGVGSERLGARGTLSPQQSSASLEFDLDAIRGPMVDGASSTGDDTDVDVRRVSGASSIPSNSRYIFCQAIMLLGKLARSAFQRFFCNKLNNEPNEPFGAAKLLAFKSYSLNREVLRVRISLLSLPTPFCLFPR